MKYNPPVTIVGPGGCPYVTDPLNPHLGGNFDGGDDGTKYPNDLWPWLVSAFEPNTILDVGCGTGESLAYFKQHGKNVIGIDGLPYNAAKCSERHKIPCILHDLTKGPLLIEGVDLIWCSDVAEHIEEKYVGNLLYTLANAKILAMCQGNEDSADQGWHHVNNKPEEYWVNRLAEVGMIEDKGLTEKSREKGNHGWWQLTGRIYVRAN